MIFVWGESIWVKLSLKFAFLIIHSKQFKKKGSKEKKIKLNCYDNQKKGIKKRRK